MSSERLGLATLDALPSTIRPGYDPRDLAIGLVHLGAGAFFRAHQAMYTDAVVAGGDHRWGIFATSQRSPTVSDILNAQDGLYGVLERSTRNGARGAVVGAVRRAACASADPHAVVDAIADPAVHAVTLTVTEKGYRAQEGQLATTDPEIEADLAGRPPLTVVGQLVRGMQKRDAAGAGPIALISCDNLSDNGSVLRRLVHQFADRLNGNAAPRIGEYIERHVTFPCTMVDRIVPATTDADRADVERLLGVRDDACVVAEPFSQWVIADEFHGPRPAWERAGAVLTDDVAGYEQVKLRLLNATHSLIAYLGGISGYATIAEALCDPSIESAARRLIDDDQIPTLRAPNGLDLRAYREDVLSRFANPALGHTTAQVAMDGSQKLPQRVLSAVRQRRAAGAMPATAALLVAAWMRFLLGRDDQGRRLEVSDPLADRLVPLLSRPAPAREVIRDTVEISGVFGPDLCADEDLLDTIAAWFDALCNHGVAETLRGA
ncbi:mannitol dehydrogenase family protein [Actinobacteria bacterium YIM 96077]|uniref:Mannitol-1-phosphate 5-dehydrogenase n=1 Tax=Phytoactinopolyspora halophila TaxID=1981511 RepID=A0A329R071_9ACTN|nr:mannitol dehydrogenase family protein [Phytoactinopolyspora halophila]AYY11497.1 mannitol dehydrogenase family protein [Actinobacteria bacterium YIM 96077]RAW18020.1 mannitol dehydrogenase family protein [Phytoactinopolyspora halophila]